MKPTLGSEVRQSLSLIGIALVVVLASIGLGALAVHLAG